MLVSFRILSIVILSMILSAARADTPVDDLKNCVLNKTTVEEKANIYRMVFMAAANSPIIGSLISIQNSKVDELNKKATNDFVNIYTQQCRLQTVNALKSGYRNSIIGTYQILTKTSISEQFATPEVVEKFSEFFKGAVKNQGFQKFLDEVYQ